jgi:hypothetical protein
MKATSHKQVQYELRQALELYRFDRKALGQANRMLDKAWKSRALSNMNRSRARLMRAIKAAESLLGRNGAQAV